MFWLCLLNEPLEPFLPESRLLRVNSIRMRRTSLTEWSKWLSVVRTSVFPKAFTELTLGLSDVLKVAPFTFYQVYQIFWVARYGVGDFSSFFSCKKSIVCLIHSEKRTGEAALVVAFFNSYRLHCWPEIYWETIFVIDLHIFVVINLHLFVIRNT